MGVHLCYELSLSADVPEVDVAPLISALRERALALPFDHVSESVRLTEQTLAGPLPLRGLAYTRLEDVAHVSAALARAELWRRRFGVPDEDEHAKVDVPPGAPTVARAFAVDPGRGCEPATFGVAQLAGHDRESSPWWWHRCCKTQYASVLGDDHLICCHGSLVELLDAAAVLGFDVVVRDETGYWESRDPRQLVEAVAKMNRIVARLAGKLTDAMRDAGTDSRQVKGAIFEHPDFERLEG
jgi:hypothetical protein